MSFCLQMTAFATWPWYDSPGGRTPAFPDKLRVPYRYVTKKTSSSFGRHRDRGIGKLLYENGIVFARAPRLLLKFFGMLEKKRASVLQ